MNANGKTIIIMVSNKNCAVIPQSKTDQDMQLKCIKGNISLYQY